jgi:hypothetical protein
MTGREKLYILFAVIGGAAIMAAKALPSVIDRMAELIRDWESGGNLQARSYRNNNPGNLKTAGQAGVVGADEYGHAIFDSYENGWQALIRQVTIAFNGQSHVYSPDDTLYSFFSKYAEDNSGNYAEYVASGLGVSPETQLKNITTA